MPLLLDEVRSIFSPPVTGVAVSMGPEAARAFNRIREWLEPVIDRAQRQEWVKDEFGQDNFDEVVRMAVVSHPA
jgi:hypothetical protein